MGVQFFNVNTSAAIELSYKLEKLTRAAFPLAVRGTLNAAAFDMKTNTLQESAKRNFIQRAPTFFRRFSAVNKANGLDVNTMQAEIGMTNQGEEKAQTPVRQLLQQEVGGDIGSGLDYLKGARGGSLTRRVVRSQYFDRSRVVEGQFKRATTQKSKFVASAYVSLREKKRLTFAGRDGRKFTVQVTSIRKTKKGKITINTKLLYVNRDGKPVKIRATHFSQEAAMLTVRSMPAFYQAEAEKQFAKALKK